MKHKLVFISLIIIAVLFISCGGKQKDIDTKSNNTDKAMVNNANHNNDSEKNYNDIKTINPIIVAKAFSKDEDLFLENNYYMDFSPQIKASSCLKDNTKISYDAKNIRDGDLGTAWVEGNNDYGIGEYIKFTSDKSDSPYDIKFIDIYNGYRKNEKLWEANSRVKTIKLWKNNEPIAILELKDTMDIQRFFLDPQVTIMPGESLELKFEIMDIYKGKKYKDTSITEIDMGSGI